MNLLVVPNILEDFLKNKFESTIYQQNNMTSSKQSVVENQGKFTCLWIFPWTIFDLSSCKGGLGKSLFDQIREIKVSMRQALEIITSQVFLHDLLKYFKIHILYKFSFTLKCKLAVLHVQNAL